MRIAVAGFMHESNTFNPIPADRGAFTQQGLAHGADLLTEWRDAHHEVAGFFQAGTVEGFELVPLLMAWATPSGPIAGTIIEVDTPGLTAINPARLPYRHIRRPLWPLE